MRRICTHTDRRCGPGECYYDPVASGKHLELPPLTPELRAKIAGIIEPLQGFRLTPGGPAAQVITVKEFAREAPADGAEAQNQVAAGG